MLIVASQLLPDLWLPESKVLSINEKRVHMAWHIVMHLFSALVDWFRIGRLKDHEKDLEILILRQQLEIAERKLHKSVRMSLQLPGSVDRGGLSGKAVCALARSNGIGEARRKSG